MGNTQSFVFFGKIEANRKFSKKETSPSPVSKKSPSVFHSVSIRLNMI